MAERHHFYLQHHCTTAMYPQSMPNIQLPSREARFYWRLYTANGHLGGSYEVNLSRALLRTLKRTKRPSMTLKNIIISPELVKVKHLDCIERQRVINEIKHYLSCQKNLENLSMENLRLMRMEGINLVSAVENSRKTLKCLHCWGAFGRAEGPLLVDRKNFNGSGLYKDCLIRRSEWLEALGSLEALTTLSLNYAYIATAKGHFLIDLAKKIGGHWRWLQLLCLEAEIPIIKDVNNGVGGHRIPDFAWKTAVELAPDLEIQFVFVDVYGYDNQMRFLSKSIPVHTMIISISFEVGIPEDPSMIDCTLKNLWCWYPATLGKEAISPRSWFANENSERELSSPSNVLVAHLSLHLWHNREMLDPLLLKILMNLPQLQVLEFTGEIRKCQTLHNFCTQIQEREHKVNHIHFQLQKPINEKMDEASWRSQVISTIFPFQVDFDKFNLTFILNFYQA